MTVFPEVGGSGSITGGNSATNQSVFNMRASSMSINQPQLMRQTVGAKEKAPINVRFEPLGGGGGFM